MTPPRSAPPPLVAAAVVGLLLFTAYFVLWPMQNSGEPRLLLAFKLLDYFLTPADGSVPSGLRFLPQRLDLAAVAAAVLAGAAAGGSLLLRLLERLGGRDSLGLTRPERAALSLGLGLAGWSLFTLGCGMAGALSCRLFWTVLAGVIVGEVAALLWRRRVVRIRETARRVADSRLAWACLAVTAPFLAAAALAAMLPPTDFDVREYHLGGPKEYFLDGRVNFLPHNVYTSFPFLTEMLSLSAMTLRGDWFRGALAGQLVLWSFYPLTALTVLCLGRRLFGATAGWLAAAVYVTTPWAYRIGVIAYAEGGLTAYLALATLAFLVAAERFLDGRSATASVSLTGLLAGAGMACKYPGALQVVIPLGLALLWTAWSSHRSIAPASRLPIRALAGVAAAYTAGVLAMAGPWLLKNLVETGNPVYPLLWSLFGGVDWDAALNAKWKAAHSPPDFRPASLARDLMNVAVASDWQSLLVFGLAPFALLGPRRRRAGFLWLFVGFLTAAWWLATHRIDRFWLPLLPAACVLAGAGAVWTRARAWRYAAGVVAAVAALGNLAVVVSPFAGNPQYLGDLDAMTDVSQVPGLRVLNATLPPDAKVLLVGEAEIFDARFPLLYNTVFDHSLFERWAAPGPDAFRRLLAERGVTHVYVNWNEVLRYRTTYGFTPFVTPERFASLQAAGVLGPPQVVTANTAKEFQDRDDAVQRRVAGAFSGLARGGLIVTGELYPVTR